MLLFVGLGNPGTKHARNRHNIGFMAVDEIARRHRFGPFRSRFQGLIAEGKLDGKKVLALEPLTFMNRSGQSVAAAARFYKIAPADIVVFHDELDLAAAKVRVKRGGGAAGHNGLRSLDQHIDADYRRVRLGIGHPGDRNRVHSYVLHDFAKADQGWLDALLAAVGEAAPLLAMGDDGEFMNRVSIATRPFAKPDETLKTPPNTVGPGTDTAV
ncbi:MAG: aminoacyl-tRNA hydrolase [Alphaproteobacteria bacterium]|nr:aminoacyl-tRNA hydrolase [Alphaproteobacteria bacterium]